MADDGWTTVGNKKREKAAARKKRRKKEAEEKAKDEAAIPGDDGYRTSSLARQPRKSSKKGSSGDDNDNGGSKYKAPTRNQPKKKKRASKGIRPKTRDAMAELIAQFIKAERLGSLDTAGLGSRIQTATQTSWNTSFKKDFGSLRSFLASRPEFVVLDNGDVAMAPTASAKARARRRKKGRNANGGAGANSSNGGAGQGGGASSSSSEYLKRGTSPDDMAPTSCCWKITRSVLVLFLFAALALASMAVIQGVGPTRTFVEQAWRQGQQAGAKYLRQLQEKLQQQ